MYQMANQFTTGQGQGFDPNDDPSKRMLGSGVNSGQGLANMDPGKMANPYAMGGGSPAQTRAANPYAPPNPYGPAAPGQKPNPYMRAPPVAAGQPPAPGQAPAQTGARRANDASGAPPGIAPPASVTGAAPPYTPPVNPAGNYVPYGPNQQEFNDLGRSLASSAHGDVTDAQKLADSQQFFSQYLGQAQQAADRSASMGVTGVSGQSQGMQQAIAGSISNAIAQRRAADIQESRAAYQRWLDSGNQQRQFAQQQGLEQQRLQQSGQQFEETRGLEQQKLQESAQEAYNQLLQKAQDEQKQRELERKRIEQQQNEPFWKQAADIGGNLVQAGGAAAANIDWAQYLPELAMMAG